MTQENERNKLNTEHPYNMYYAMCTESWHHSLCATSIGDAHQQALAIVAKTGQQLISVKIQHNFEMCVTYTNHPRKGMALGYLCASATEARLKGYIAASANRFKTSRGKNPSYDNIPYKLTVKYWAPYELPTPENTSWITASELTTKADPDPIVLTKEDILKLTQFDDELKLNEIIICHAHPMYPKYEQLAHDTLERALQL